MFEAAGVLLPAVLVALATPTILGIAALLVVVETTGRVPPMRRHKRRILGLTTQSRHHLARRLGRGAAPGLVGLGLGLLSVATSVALQLVGLRHNGHGPSSTWGYAASLLQIAYIFTVPTVVATAVIAALSGRLGLILGLVSIGVAAVAFFV